MDVTITNTENRRSILITNPTEKLKCALERMREYKAARHAECLRRFQDAKAL